MDHGTQVTFRYAQSQEIVRRTFWQSEVTKDFAPDKVTHGERAVSHMIPILPLTDWHELRPVLKD